MGLDMVSVGFGWHTRLYNTKCFLERWYMFRASPPGITDSTLGRRYADRSMCARDASLPSMWMTAVPRIEAVMSTTGRSDRQIH
jgi:hypothetical protein